MAENKPCVRPEEMSEQQLRAEMSQRGLSAEGSRTEIIARFNTPDDSELTNPPIIIFPNDSELADS